MQWTVGPSFAVARAGHTQGICARISHRTHTDRLRVHGASITTSLAAGGRAFTSRRTATTGGHEARTPRHSGPRILPSHRSSRFSPLGQLTGTIAIEKRE